MFHKLRNKKYLFRHSLMLMLFLFFVYSFTIEKIYSQTDSSQITVYSKILLDCSDKADIFGWSHPEYVNCVSNQWNEILLKAYADEKLPTDEDIAALSAHIPIFAKDIKRINDNPKPKMDEPDETGFAANPFYHDVSIAAYIIVTTNHLSKIRAKCLKTSDYEHCMDKEFETVLSRLKISVTNFDLSAFEYKSWDSVSRFLQLTFNIPEMTEEHTLFPDDKRLALKKGREERLPMDCSSIIDRINSTEDLLFIREKWRKDVIRKFSKITYDLNPDTLFYLRGFRYADDPVEEFISRRTWEESLALDDHFSAADNAFIRSLKFCKDTRDCDTCLKKQLELQALILSAKSIKVIIKQAKLQLSLDILIDKALRHCRQTSDCKNCLKSKTELETFILTADEIDAEVEKEKLNSLFPPVLEEELKECREIEDCQTCIENRIELQRSDLSISLERVDTERERMAYILDELIEKMTDFPKSKSSEDSNGKILDYYLGLSRSLFAELGIDIDRVIKDNK